MEKNNLNLFSWFSKTKEECIEEHQLHSFNPTLELERNIGKQIYDALQGEIVEEVLRKIKISSHDAYWRSAMEGHSLKVEQELLPDVYQLCQEVKAKLNFEEAVDFYITGDSSVNAFSLAAEDQDQPHIVNINSALFDLMSRDELKFVIGHELGHLINKDSALGRLIRFVFPPETNIPISLQYKIRLHDQLAELVADRYGYIAVENLEACVTAFFKMASGLDLAKMISWPTTAVDSNISSTTKVSAMLRIPLTPFVCKLSTFMQHARARKNCKKVWTNLSPFYSKWAMANLMNTWLSLLHQRVY